MRGLVKVFKALSDESRLRVLNLILERECCVCEVMQALEISQSKASRILSTLHDVGFLKLHKDGLWSLYSVDSDGMDAYLKEILTATRTALRNNRQMETDRERLKTAIRTGPGCVNRNAKVSVRRLSTSRKPMETTDES
ncbi:MAG: metalloregulator ArsR/SmtB family transcription factor [Dehalococcoidia bacterium]|nr:metalloregulator ArsR/SmtB family transcription factor [Dehalococcoidia bacterium]